MFQNVFLLQLPRAQCLNIRSGLRSIHKSTSSVLQQNQNYDIRDSIIIYSNDHKKRVEAIKLRKLGMEQPREQKHILIKNFKHFFSCSEETAAKMVQENKALRKVPLDKINRNIEILYDKMSAKTIIENLWLLGLSEHFLEEKLELIEKLQPRDINDFIPLITVSSLMLSRAQKRMQRERKHIPEGNRIYYFSKRLDVNPALVSKYFATHMFMFEVAFDQLVENLNVMLEFNVSSINILRDLWAFKYLPTSIRTRLERCQKADKENLMPWMIRCTEEILERSLTLSQESKNLLGDSTVVDYISERLGYDIETTKSIVSNHKSVLKVRVTRMKDIFDFLIIEEKYKPFEIANNIRILCHSLQTTKARLDKLRQHGCRPTSLVVVCKSQTEFNKFLKSWIDQREGKKDYLKPIR